MRGKICLPSGTWQMPADDLMGVQPCYRSAVEGDRPGLQAAIPEMDMSVVDFPAPLAPMSATISPCAPRGSRP